MGIKLIRWAFAATVVISIVSLFAVQIISFDGRRNSHYYSSPPKRLMVLRSHRYHQLLLQHRQAQSQNRSTINHSLEQERQILPYYEKQSVPNKASGVNSSARALRSVSTEVATQAANVNISPNFIETISRFTAGRCQDELCSEYLNSSLDGTLFVNCISRAQSYRIGMSPEDQKEISFVNSKLLASGNCHFMNGTKRGRVGLISFPGSGNTWVRGLLETATGICTGELLLATIGHLSCHNYTLIINITIQKAKGFELKFEQAISRFC